MQRVDFGVEGKIILEIAGCTLAGEIPIQHQKEVGDLAQDIELDFG